MSDPVEIGLDLDKLFLPSWAQQPAENRYANFEGGGEGRGDRREGGRPGGPRRDFGGPRRDFGNRGPGGPGGRPGGRPGGPGGPRPGGFGGPSGPRSDRDRGGCPGGPGGPGGPRRSGPPRGGAPGLEWDPSQGGAPRGDRRGGDRDRRDRQFEPLIPVEVNITPEPTGVASLARQIRLSCRAYPLFEIAGLVMQKPDRFNVSLKTQRTKEGKVAQPLFVCSLDDTVWLGEAEAAKHILTHHFDTFYSTNKIPTDPPKGVYTFVAQCGISGEVLGPPNFHGYQDKLRRLHAERFGRMPFDMYKSRVKIVKDEAVVKSWIESQSFRFEYTTLNVPEPKQLNTREEVEAHFREVHLPVLLKQVDSHPVKREAIASLPGPLQTLIRVTLDRERKFPLRAATALSIAFQHQGLQFFKRDKAVVHVAVSRPHYLDLETQVVSDGVKRIVAHLVANPTATRRQLVDALAPLPAAAAAPAPAPAPAPAAEPAATEPAAEGAAPAAAAAPAAPAAPATTPEREAVLTDLHWLLMQGHVLEFGNGTMELAKKPAPKPEPAPKAPKAEKGDKPEKGPRPEREPGSRRRGLFPVAQSSVMPYGPVASLAGY